MPTCFVSYAKVMCVRMNELDASVYESFRCIGVWMLSAVCLSLNAFSASVSMKCCSVRMWTNASACTSLYVNLLCMLTNVFEICVCVCMMFVLQFRMCNACSGFYLEVQCVFLHGMCNVACIWYVCACICICSWAWVWGFTSFLFASGMRFICASMCNMHRYMYLHNFCVCLQVRLPVAGHTVRWESSCRWKRLLAAGTDAVEVVNFDYPCILKTYPFVATYIWLHCFLLLNLTTLFVFVQN
jgi:hypothetical protein